MDGMKQKTFSDELKAAISECGLSRYEIAKRSGATEAALSRFINGKTGLTTDTIDKIAPVIGLVVKVRR